MLVGAWQGPHTPPPSATAPSWVPALARWHAAPSTHAGLDPVMQGGHSHPRGQHEAHRCPRGPGSTTGHRLPSVTALPCSCQTLQPQQSRSEGTRSRLQDRPWPPAPAPAPHRLQGGGAEPQPPPAPSNIYENTLLWKWDAQELSVQYKPTAATHSPAHRHGTAGPEAHPRGAAGAGGAVAPTSPWAWR